jgi:2-succinyl-5-enolpyruvyl-6-hydroxy-3-cyclohexene-1-carboxylate synthase
MSLARANATAALALVQELSRMGVFAACVSPGSRSSALALAVAKTPALRSWVILDERVAAYFALGAARATGRPAMVVCTSGTAAANCLPAIVEASLSHVPLIVVSADRPPELQDCHAPQTIDQRRLFGVHVRLSIELPAPTGAEPPEYFQTAAFRAVDAAFGMPPGPVHINFPMREPLLDVEQERAALKALSTEPASGAGAPAPRVLLHPAAVTPARAALKALGARLRKYRRGIILCGPGLADRAGTFCADRRAARQAICELARRLDWPILADPLSGLRFGWLEQAPIVDAYDIVLREPGLCAELSPDAVLQFGRPLTSKPLQRFLAALDPRPFYLVAAPWGSWPDPQRCATDAIRADAGELARGLLEYAAPAAAGWRARWLALGREVRRRLNCALAAQDAISECALFPALLRLLPEGAALHVGNSMPVRDLDTFGESSDRVCEVFCNRGANGIDGVLSAAAGAGAAGAGPVVAVLGDLSFLHDLGALKAAAYAPHLVVIVVNNDGGGIFSFLPQAGLGEAFETYFATPHGLERLEPAAALYGARYAFARSIEEFEQAVAGALGAPGLHIVEIRTERAQNAALHETLIKEALKAARRAPKHAR